ncbi:MAG: hypothetical protein F6K25_05875 [Okeania sp. SIO2G4]|uniref:hypothetical protein n=1 Tax=unclassified Okeania TaxID=2634635 RepID=UPI0013B8FF6A|nr:MULTISPECIES: hypothetical protein [unclassified Okeania]NEP41862.1 hypothetical protein [Okeania sp. SIO2H7]NEP71519.1 hypothetical protein [Okeania sp. SIO2G5]NEP92806.1 hypothetical protein [Okeania sp. SIO2F5]NEQ90274.1 hypothetical protein [Okeania sp. SIO2G4]
MDYEHLKQAIKLLTNATQKLENIISEKSTNQANNQTVEFAQETIKKAMAEISAAINPPIINHIPDEFLAKAESLGIPLDDVEVIVAISEHHPSQLLGVLAEIENRAENIKRRREYFLLRLPEMPREKLGPRLPVIKASDFNLPEEPISQEYREAIKAKYKIDRLMKKRPYSRATIFEKIKQAEAIFAESQEQENESGFDEEIPF